MPQADAIAVADSALAKRIIGRFDKLKSDRDSFYLPSWRSAAEWLCPRKSSILGSEKTPGEAGWVDNLFDMTGAKASERLAAWLMTNTSPANARWFAFTSGPKTRRRLGRNATARVAQWWQHVTEVTLEQIATSNFYTEKHEALLDRNNFGTCALGCFEGKRRSALSFRGIQVGTFVLGADDEGYVDTVMREFKLSSRQAAQMFGVESLGPKVRAAYNATQPGAKDQEFTFLHAVYPNSDRNPALEDAGNKAWKSCYVCKEDERVMQEGGYDEMPYAVSRFLKWTGEVWGWAPAFTALPTVRETNFFKMQMNALVEMAAFPPMAEPDTMVGTLDLRAGARNTYDTSMPEALPKPLYQPDASQMQPGVELLAENRQFIDQCFYGDVIAMFSNLEREVTAFEAAQLMSEKLDVFSPYYFRLINELDTPTLERVFSILLAGGFYDDPPPELLVDNGDGTATLDTPEVVYLSRLALAIQAHEVGSFDALVQRATMLAQIDPAIAAEFMKPLDLQRASRGMQRNLGLPVAWQRTDEEMAELAAAEAEQVQMAQAAETAPALAKAAKDVDSMSPRGKAQAAQLLQGQT